MADYLCINKSIFNDRHWRTNDRRKGILIESEAFPGSVCYVIKGQSIVLLSGNHGLFCFDLKCGDRFLSELAEVIACYQS